MKQTRSQTYFLIAFLALAGVAAVLWAASYYGRMPIHPYVSMGFRWVALLALCGYAFLRRSLTAWIFAGMLVGAELGHELGKSAANLQLLSAIFLRLIKTIIAPLIFSTLVVGIAGHSDLKQVGRMGVKALIYFEVVTTLALFIGLGAINLSKAGVGVQQPAMQMEEVKTVKQSAADVVLHMAFIARVPLKRFLRAVAEPASIAFATATSEAALPRAMEQMEAMGVPRQIVAFVMPTGYSFNLDGSTLYLALATIFVAQAA